MIFSDTKIIIFPMVIFYEQIPDTGRCNGITRSPLLKITITELGSWYNTFGFTTATRMSQHGRPCLSALNLNILWVCSYCVSPRGD